MIILAAFSSCCCYEFWLFFFSCCCRGFCCCCWSPDTKTQWQWRTEKHQNCTPKMPNVTSETHRKWWFWRLFPLLLWILATFFSCCCRGFCCCCCWSPDTKTQWQWRTEKHQNCTPKMPNVTSETHRKWWFWRLFPLAAAMNFGYCRCRGFWCCCCWSRMGKHHVSEGRRSPKIAPRKCLT